MLNYGWIDVQSAKAARMVNDVAEAADHAHARRYRDKRKQQASLTARALLKTLLAKESGYSASTWQIGYDDAGRPWGVHPEIDRPVHTSLSHSGAFAAAVVSQDYPVAIDLERMKSSRSWRQIAATLFPDMEEATTDIAAFYRAWCLHEAWVKLSGGSVWTRSDTTEFHQLFKCLIAGEQGHNWALAEFHPDAGTMGVVIQDRKKGER